VADTSKRATELLARVVRDLGAVSDDVVLARDLLALLGWTVPPGVADIGLTKLDVGTLVQRLDALADLRSQEDAAAADVALAVAGVADALLELFDHVRAVVGGFEATPEYLHATQIRDEFFPRLADIVLIQALGQAAPAAVPLGVLLGLFEMTHRPADPRIFQAEHIRQVVRWDRLGTLLSDPASVLKEVYGWGTPAYAGNQLVMNLGSFCEHFCDALSLRPMPRAVEEALFGRAVPEADTDPAAQLFVSIAKGLGVGAYDVGVSLYRLRASSAGGSDGGLGLSPYVIATSSAQIGLSEALTLQIAGSADVETGLALLLRAGRDAQLLTGLLDAPGASTSDSNLAMTLKFADPDGGRLMLFSAAGLSLDVASLSAGIAFTGGTALDPALRAGLEDGRLTLTADPDDGFLGSLLPASGITATVKLDLSWSERAGLHVHGGVGLQTTLDLHQRVGPLQIDTIDLGIAADGGGVATRATLSGSVTLGPVTAVVDGAGAALALRFRAGNLGAVDLGAEFIAPSGIGLAIEVPGVIEGGGLLFHDPVQALYAGVLQLSVHETIDVSAFGLIATRLPDGSKGYSLLVFITADGFQPIQLGLGFTLLGIGGMVGVHRSFDENVLRAGLKNDTLAGLLFPRDPIANAPAIIRAVSAAFPARSGSYLIGLLVRIGWFTPTLITADLAVILEFGARKRLLLLGRVRAALPSADRPLLRLTLDAVGVVDFDAGSAALDAVLVDSRLLERFVLTGSAALRSRWSRPRSFALAVGGMNPGFTLPADFPVLERLTLSLATGDNPRVTCQAYFALTSNTVQFGAQAHLYAAAFGFSVSGDAGFDVLITLAPFHFLAEFNAGMQLKRGSSNLFKVTVKGALEGPAPLTVRATASFEIFWWDVSIRVNATLAEGDAPPLPAPVDALAQLQAALRDVRNWHAELPDAQTRVASLREAAGSDTLRVHPLGTLRVRQGVVPLNLERDIDRYGEAPVAGARRFRVSAATLDGLDTGRTPIGDDFAPAQFFEMSDDAKLVAPSYESMDAGVAFGAPGCTFDLASAIASPLDYETALVDAQAARDDPAPPYRLDDALLSLHARHGAAGRSALRRFGADAPTPYAVLRNEGYAVVDAVLAAPESQATAGSLTFAEATAVAARRSGLRAVPAFQVDA
jgi:hypothetical protein